jgi:hypothetical protein
MSILNRIQQQLADETAAKTAAAAATAAEYALDNQKSREFFQTIGIKNFLTKQATDLTAEDYVAEVSESTATNVGPRVFLKFVATPGEAIDDQGGSWGEMNTWLFGVSGSSARVEVQLRHARVSLPDAPREFYNQADFSITTLEGIYARSLEFAMRQAAAWKNR